MTPINMAFATRRVSTCNNNPFTCLEKSSEPSVVQAIDDMISTSRWRLSTPTMCLCAPPASQLFCPDNLIVFLLAEDTATLIASRVLHATAPCAFGQGTPWISSLLVPYCYLHHLDRDTTFFQLLRIGYFFLYKAIAMVRNFNFQLACLLLFPEGSTLILVVIPRRYSCKRVQNLAHNQTNDNSTVKLDCFAIRAHQISSFVLLHK